MRLILLCSVASVVTLGCKPKDDTDDPVVAGCEDCVETDICVAHVDESGATEDYAICISRPSECVGGLSCDDNTCKEQAWAACDAGFVGGLCEEDENPPLTCYAEVP